MADTSQYIDALRKTHPEVVFLDRKEVGYPLFRAQLNLVLRKDRDLLLQEEFVLRALAQGIRDRVELGRFLGVEDFFVDKTLSALLSGELVQRTEEGLAVTDAGREAVSKQAVDDVVIEGTNVLIDALTGEVHLYQDFQLNEVKKPPYTISPIRARPQQDVTDFIPYLEDIQDALRSADDKVELISIESVEWSRQVWHQLDFVTYQASPAAEDVRYVFFLQRNIEPVYRKRIDDLQSSGHQVIEHLLEEDLVDQDEQETEIRKVLDAPDEVVRRAEEVKAELTTTRFQQPETDAEVEELRLRVRELENELAEIAEKHDVVDVLHTEELRQHLIRALTNAKQRLLIISPWVKNDVVTPNFLELLERALKRGVAVRILYGYKHRGSYGDHPKAVNNLKQLERKYDHFEFERILNTHSKILACDYQFGITSSFNFLSFRADPNRTYRDETGALVTRRDAIDKLYAHGDGLLREVSYLL